jgi:hypothetical protein
MSTEVILYDTNFSVFNLLLFAFGYFDAILSCVFLSLSLSFVLLLEGKGPRCSDSEFDYCAFHAHMTVLREGAVPVLSQRLVG